MKQVNLENKEVVVVKTQQKKIFTVRRLPDKEELAVDGSSSNKIWNISEKLEDFTFPWIIKEPPKTVFRSLWDDKYLYFRFDVTDEEVILGNGININNKVIGSDRAEFLFAKNSALDSYFGLEIDPRGNVLSYRGKFHHTFDWDWKCKGLKVFAQKSDDGYFVEVAIPQTTLIELECIHETTEGLYMIVGLFRAEFSKAKNGEIIENWMSWVDPNVKSPDFHIPSAFGVLKLEKILP